MSDIGSFGFYGLQGGPSMDRIRLCHIPRVVPECDFAGHVVLLERQLPSESAVAISMCTTVSAMVFARSSVDKQLCAH